MKNTMLILIGIIAFMLLCLSQQARLNAYNDWYMCDVYGHEEYCNE